jgi:hypothetical protein
MMAEDAPKKQSPMVVGALAARSVVWVEVNNPRFDPPCGRRRKTHSPKSSSDKIPKSSGSEPTW